MEVVRVAQFACHDARRDVERLDNRAAAVCSGMVYRVHIAYAGIQYQPCGRVRAAVAGSTALVVQLSLQAVVCKHVHIAYIYFRVGRACFEFPGAYLIHYGIALVGYCHDEVRCVRRHKAYRYGRFSVAYRVDADRAVAFTGPVRISEYHKFPVPVGRNSVVAGESASNVQCPCHCRRIFCGINVPAVA